MGKLRRGLLFLLICTLSRTCSTANYSSILSRLPDMLQHLCPGAKVCRENQTMQAQEREFWPGQTSCCTECSCGSDCKENGNCCFPTMQSYTSENEDYDHVLQNKRVCLYPTTLDLQEKQKVSFQSYYMISSVSSDIENNSSSSCGDTPVALWGSLFPVYSAKRNQIYKNIACATADGVTDGQSWEVLLTCRADRDGRSMLLEPNDYVYRVVNSDFNYKNCHISFIFKGSMEEIKHLQCHRDVTDVCPDFGLFQITDDIGFSEKEIIEGCTSGLVSPYRMEKMYANVFCHICNKERFRMKVTCPVISSALALRGPLTTSFSGIIDAEIFLKKSRTNVDVIKPKTPIACSKQNKESCRPVYCPSGQLYDRSGKCKFSIQLLYDQLYVVQQYLTADIYVNITEVLLKSNVKALNSPWPSDWVIHQIWVDIANEKKTRLMVLLEKNIHSIRLPFLLKYIKQMVKREWVLEHKTATLVLKSDFNSTFTKTIDSPVHFENRIEEISLPSYILVFKRLKLPNYMEQKITRLYFCNQVELTHSEFILSDNRAVVFNILSKRYLFDGEFKLINNTEFGEFRVRICIEDSGLNEVSQATVSKLINTNTFLKIFCVLMGFQYVI